MCILLKCLGSGVVTQSVQKDVQGCKESVVHILGDRCPLCMEPTQEIGGRYCVFNVYSIIWMFCVGISVVFYLRVSIKQLIRRSSMNKEIEIVNDKY